MEVLKMENKYLTGGFCPSNVNPIKQGAFLDTCYAKNKTTYGAYKIELQKGLLWAVDVLDGKLKKVELVDQKADLLFTHMKKGVKPHIFRKNGRTDLTHFTINHLSIELLTRFKRCAIDHFPDKRDKLSCLADYAMDLYVKVENGFVKLVETGNKPVRSFISDERGQFNSINTNNRNELVELINYKFKHLEQNIGAKIESTVQSTLNLVSKPVKRGKKAINGNGKSGKVKAKLDKSERILNNLKKRYEHRFTNKEYGEPLAKLTGQGDNRTVRSDLETLEGAGLIKKVRSSANGVKTYEFTENTEYYKYNSDLGKTKFFDDFKEKFSDQDALTMDDLNKFILEKYELFDAQSQNKRLRWLLDEGYVKRHEVNPKLLFIQK